MKSNTNEESECSHISARDSLAQKRAWQMITRIDVCKNTLKYALISMCMCSFAFGNWFMNGWDTQNPPSLEQSLKSLLALNCSQVDMIKGTTKPHKGKKAIEQCKKEQKFLLAIANDDTQTYQSIMKNGEGNAYFSFYTTHSPRLEITPLMAAIALNSTRVFNLILADSAKSKRFSTKKPLYDINRVMSDEQRHIGAFRLGNGIYDAYGVNALDLAAMYRRYDMFWALLNKGAEYNNPKYPLTNGIIAFGDRYILELMLQFDKEFLEHFGGGHILHFLARDGNVELLEYLIVDKNMPIDTLRAGETPLDAALNAKNFQHKPQLEAAQKLIELGAKVSEANAHRIHKLTHQKDKQ
ncbi:ankyrin repeat domain-containing protein [Helicobacter typhlonius]|uniref:ankyrin repeat domain-containing protein n=1 Tax=Helicobacter typhlonius TaxID=76936 RepID=UPI002FE25059